jgi:NYN domain
VSILSIVQPSTSSNNGAQNQKEPGCSADTARVAILLLDAENIKLCAEEEKFLETCCKHSLQIKIAFANWRAISKQQDLELNDRGYQMIHVPAGKNSADMKMTALGSSLFVAYPNVKEVFVCSSDSDLAHLCNTLRLHGLTAYAVRRGSASLQVINTATKQSFSYVPPVPALKILPLEDCLNGIKDLIRAQQKLISSPWVETSWLAKKFYETYGFSLNQLVSYHLPDKKAKDLFLDRPEEFVIHQMAGQQVTYISLFASPTQDASSNLPPANPTDPIAEEQKKPAPIRSKQQLEKALLKVLKSQTAKTNTKYLSMNDLLSEFRKQQENSLRYFLDTLNIKGKALIFLKSCPKLELKQVDNIWQVSEKA